jgi:hypothetical protein
VFVFFDAFSTRAPGAFAVKSFGGISNSPSHILAPSRNGRLPCLPASTYSMTSTTRSSSSLNARAGSRCTSLFLPPSARSGLARVSTPRVLLVLFNCWTACPQLFSRVLSAVDPALAVSFTRHATGSPAPMTPPRRPGSPSTCPPPSSQMMGLFSPNPMPPPTTAAALPATWLEGEWRIQFALFQPKQPLSTINAPRPHKLSPSPCPFHTSEPSLNTLTY